MSENPTITSTITEVAINDIGTEEDLIAAVDATIKYFNDGDIVEGTVVKVTKGATTAHVVLELAGGAKVTASITNEAVEDLGLKAGDKAKAIVKASDVLVAID